MDRKRKISSDYPQFYCRMTEEDKLEIEGLVQQVTALAILKWKQEKKVRLFLKPRRNEFIAKALRKGLMQLIKELNK